VLKNDPAEGATDGKRTRVRWVSQRIAHAPDRNTLVVLDARCTTRPAVTDELDLTTTVRERESVILNAGTAPQIAQCCDGYSHSDPFMRSNRVDSPQPG